jgi:hypothetical protein
MVLVWHGMVLGSEAYSRNQRQQTPYWIPFTDTEVQHGLPWRNFIRKAQVVNKHHHHHHCIVESRGAVGVLHVTVELVVCLTYNHLYWYLQCHFSWDWGPCFLTQGIWLPAHIIAYSDAVISYVVPQITKPDRQQNRWNVLVCTTCGHWRIDLWPPIQPNPTTLCNVLHHPDRCVSRRSN